MSSEVIYNRIAMLRAERGISRRELADALGVHYQTVGYLERGEYSPSLYLALRIAADTGEPDAFTWTEHVLGAPGYRLAGGTDEIQRNIIGERVLGLPREPRVDKRPSGG